MREIRHFELDADICIARRFMAACALEVDTGKVWVTLEHDACDYWLTPGERLVVPAKCRIWLSAEAGGARLRVTDLISSAAPGARRRLPRWAM